MKLKKIVFINCSDGGSTGKIIKDTAAYISTYDWTSVLCVPRIRQQNESCVRIRETSLKYEQGVYRRIAYLTGNLYGFEPLSTHRILSVIRKEKPDIVHIHCTNGCTVNIYKLLAYLKKHDIATVVTNHAEFFYTGYCDHANTCDKWMNGCGNCPQATWHYGISADKTARRWKQMKEAFTGFKRLCVTSVSLWVYTRSTTSPIMEGVRQLTIENGINTDVFTINANASAALKEKLGMRAEERVVLHVTASFSNTRQQKGGAFLLELAQKFDDVWFVVAGPHANDFTVPHNMLLLGNITDQHELALLYAMADLCVLTSERETFGLSVAESLCCGTPVIGFCAGGPESIAMPDYSAFCPFGDVHALEDLMRTKWLTYKQSHEACQISREAKDKYSSDLMGWKYMKLYEEMVNGN